MKVFCRRKSGFHVVSLIAEEEDGEADVVGRTDDVAGHLPGDRLGKTNCRGNSENKKE